MWYFCGIHDGLVNKEVIHLGISHECLIWIPEKGLVETMVLTEWPS